MRSLLPAFAVICVLTQSAVGAETDATVPLPTAAAPCSNCHGTDGRQVGAIPTIAGRPAAILIDKLQQFRGDKTPEATVMPRLVKGLTDSELEAVAKYFSAIH